MMMMLLRVAATFLLVGVVSFATANSKNPVISMNGTLELPAGSVQLVIVGENFVPRPSAMNLTLLSVSASTLPPPKAVVVSVAKDRKSITCAISGLLNHHVGTLLGRLSYTSRVLGDGSTSFVKLAMVTNAPILIESTNLQPSSVKVVVVFGEGLLGVSTNGSTPVQKLEATVGKRNRPFPVVIEYSEASTLMVTLNQDTLSNRDTGPIRMKYTVNGLSTAWTQVGAVDIGRLAIKPNHTMLGRREGASKEFEMVFGVQESRVIPSNYVGRNKLSASTSSGNPLGISQAGFEAITNWKKGLITIEEAAETSKGQLSIPPIVKKSLDLVRLGAQAVKASGKCTDKSQWEFVCDDQSKIPFGWVCDGSQVTGCADGSDEGSICKVATECIQRGKTDKADLAFRYICDGVKDCKDGSDEFFRGCNANTTCANARTASKTDEGSSKLPGTFTGGDDDMANYYYDYYYTTAEPEPIFGGGGDKGGGIPPPGPPIGGGGGGNPPPGPIGGGGGGNPPPGDGSDSSSSSSSTSSTSTDPGRRRRRRSFDETDAERYRMERASADDVLNAESLIKNYQSSDESSHEERLMQTFVRWLSQYDTIDDDAAAERVRRNNEQQVDVRAENELPSGNPFTGINVYMKLNFEMPTQINLRTKTCANRILSELYWSKDNKYSEENSDFNVDLVFTNIIERTPLTSSGATISEVNCAQGHCAPDIPDGTFYKKTEFFVGTFTQNYDLEMYPFDSQGFEFNFTLYSNIGEVAMYSPEITYALDGQPHGEFAMSNMTCSSWVMDDGSFGRCQLTGTRAFEPVLLNLLLPTLLFVLIAILSLHLSVNLAMPRVGSTLFALLILTQYRNAALALLPPTSNFIWLDLYLFVSSVVVWVVLVLHIISQELSSTGHVILQKAIDKVASYVLVILLFEVIVMISFRDTLGLVIVGIVMVVTLIASIFGVAYSMRQQHKRKLKLEADNSASKTRGRKGSFIGRSWSRFVAPDVDLDATVKRRTTKFDANTASSQEVIAFDEMASMAENGEGNGDNGGVAQQMM